MGSPVTSSTWARPSSARMAFHLTDARKAVAARRTSRSMNSGSGPRPGEKAPTKNCRPEDPQPKTMRLSPPTRQSTQVSPRTRSSASAMASLSPGPSISPRLNSTR